LAEEEKAGRLWSIPAFLAVKTCEACRALEDFRLKAF
jgi:hypothetical protein